MPRFRRPHLRDRARTIHTLVADDPCLVWLADADQQLVVHDFADAAALAAAMLDSPVEREALALLDEFRAVTAVLFDPPPLVGLYPGLADGPGFEVPFCSTMLITPVPMLSNAAPSVVDRRSFHSLRRTHALQGLWLLDSIHVDFEQARSLAVACDPDCVWFEPFEPFAFETM
jgi:hypothetical protein